MGLLSRKSSKKDIKLDEFVGVKLSPVIKRITDNKTLLSILTLSGLYYLLKVSNLLM